MKYYKPDGYNYFFVQSCGPEEKPDTVNMFIKRDGENIELILQEVRSNGRTIHHRAIIKEAILREIVSELFPSG